MRPKKAETAVRGSYKSIQVLGVHTIIFMVDFRGKARYQHCYSAHYRGFRLVTSTFVLCILNVDLYSHIPQALRFHFNLCPLRTRACLLAMPC